VLPLFFFHLLYTSMFSIKKLYVVPTVCLWVLYESLNKQLLFPYTILSGFYNRYWVCSLRGTNLIVDYPSLSFSSFKSRATVQAGGQHPLTAKGRVQAHASPCEIWVGQSGTAIIFIQVLRHSSVNIISPVFHTLHLNDALTRRVNGQSLGIFKK